jgi:hypothetical protein
MIKIEPSHPDYERFYAFYFGGAAKPHKPGHYKPFDFKITQRASGRC